ncbi:cell division protein FtsK [Rhodococcus aetherivorans]|uniref:cell division protein FtsK n=1 Tax=Rhodococcus aetherivorans TaxID=191292 RepID=UPI00388FE39B
MPLTIKTTALIELLTDLALTADDYRGVHLRTVRGYWGSEPGEVTLLAGTSTNGYVLGHTWSYCEGSIDPHVWSVPDVGAAIALLKPLAQRDKNHTTDVALEDGKVYIRETPGLFGADTELSFEAMGDVEDFPIARAARCLSGAPLPLPIDHEGEPRPDTPRTTWMPGALEPLLKIAKRRKAQLHLFRTHALQLHRVQIGDRYIGAVSPTVAFEHDDVDKPNIDPQFGDSIPQTNVTDDDEQWLKRLGILLPEHKPDDAVEVEDDRADEPTLTDNGQDGEE